MRLSPAQIIENNLRIIADNDLKSWQDIHDYTIKTRLENKDKVMNKCEICHHVTPLITDDIRAKDRADYPGVDMYQNICPNCWELTKEIR